jgi:hypothetical protein
MLRRKITKFLSETNAEARRTAQIAGALRSVGAPGGNSVATGNRRRFLNSAASSAKRLS